MRRLVPLTVAALVVAVLALCTALPRQAGSQANPLDSCASDLRRLAKWLPI